jgi:hypothetical protein
MLRRIAFAAALSLAAVTSVSAQGQGDAKERAACRPDVMRFCKQFVKDKNDDVVSILNCLEAIGRVSVKRAVRFWPATDSRQRGRRFRVA